MSRPTRAASAAAAIIFARTLVEPLANAKAPVDRAEVLKAYGNQCARYHAEVAGDPTAGAVARAWQKQFQ
jgi:hypothetical protein